jgi:hypothetical protein
VPSDFLFGSNFTSFNLKTVSGCGYLPKKDIDFKMILLYNKLLAQLTARAFWRGFFSRPIKKRR